MIIATATATISAAVLLLYSIGVNEASKIVPPMQVEQMRNDLTSLEQLIESTEKEFIALDARRKFVLDNLPYTREAEKISNYYLQQCRDRWELKLRIKNLKKLIEKYEEIDSN